MDEDISGSEAFGERVIRHPEEPLFAEAGLAMPQCDLPSDGDVIKHLAADLGLLLHTGLEVTFEYYKDMEQHINDEKLPGDEGSVLILRNSSPLGTPSELEWDMLPADEGDEFDFLFGTASVPESEIH